MFGPLNLANEMPWEGSVFVDVSKRTRLGFSGNAVRETRGGKTYGEKDETAAGVLCNFILISFVFISGAGAGECCRPARCYQAGRQPGGREHPTHSRCHC